jgi:hypothetical protein
MHRKEKYQSKFDNLDISKGHKLNKIKTNALCTQKKPLSLIIDTSLWDPMGRNYTNPKHYAPNSPPNFHSSS